MYRYQFNDFIDLGLRYFKFLLDKENFDEYATGQTQYHFSLLFSSKRDDRSHFLQS